MAKEHSQQVNSILNTTQTDSEATSFEKARAAAGGENPDAPRSVETTKPPVPPSTDHPFGSAVASSEPQAPMDSQESKAAKPEPQTGEKREFDSTGITDSAPAPAPVPESTSTKAPTAHPGTALPETPAPAPAPVPAPAPASDERDKPLPEKSGDPEAKKQKVEPETSKDVNGSVPSGSTADANGTQKKTARPKKEKVKDAVKKAIPGDGIGSRTRSRTKPT